MKKLVFLCLTMISTTAFASNDFDYELIRTSEVPGFFMAKIFASEGATPLPMKEIFVKNFSKNEEKKYRELFPFLQQQRQARIVNGDEFNPQNIDTKKETIVVLGNPIDGFLNFTHTEGDIFESFQNFAGKNLSPVLLNNLSIKFGGNIFDVQTKKSKITSDSPAIFIGKFTKPIKTRMEITGEKLESKLGLITPLDLSDKKNTEDTTAQYLPELWDDLANPQTAEISAKKNTGLGSLKIIDLFPYILGIVVLIIIFVALRYLLHTDEESDREFDYEDEVPIFQPQMSEDEYRSYESITEKESGENDLPFEVIWKS